MRLRSAKLVCDHSAWTARARSIAARTSSGPHLGTVPSGLPVNGCSISMGSLPAVETTRAARRSSSCWVIRSDGMSADGAAEVGSAAMVDMAPDCLSFLSGSSPGGLRSTPDSAAHVHDLALLPAEAAPRPGAAAHARPSTSGARRPARAGCAAELLGTQQERLGQRLLQRRGAL